MRIVALAGGTGSAKLLRGLSREVGGFTVIANVGDNFWIHGLYVCPDIDISIYTLAGIADMEKGWGIEGDTFNALSQLSALGEDVWFKLGDRDMTMSVLRTEMLKRGTSLTQVTSSLSSKFGIKQKILPASDDPVETHIITHRGELHLQEYWVKRKARVRVKGVKYRGSEGASPTREVMSEIDNADKILICPANPITSIMPTLSIKRMRRLLSSSRAEKIAISPMIGDKPFSGPAGKLMRALGYGTDSVAVAKIYSGIIDRMVIDHADSRMKRKIEEVGPECAVTSTFMRNQDEERRLARFLAGKV